MSQRKLTRVRFHGPVTLFGKELSNVNVVNNPDLSIKRLSDGSAEIRKGNLVHIVNPSTIETFLFEDASEALSD